MFLLKQTHQFFKQYKLPLMLPTNLNDSPPLGQKLHPAHLTRDGKS